MSSDLSCKLVDLSYKDLSFLPVSVSDNRHVIEHLILDGNNLTEAGLNLTDLVKLQTLSLNRNQIKDVEGLLNWISLRCPSLKHLSLIGNPGWPHPVTANEPELYEKYRAYTAKMLPKLRFLDSTPLRRDITVDQSNAQSTDLCSFLKIKYVYTGASSEGNRYIKDTHL
uniref:Uncharacterized protein n=1 Tax=Plectus sambesii TaxID=2011161 RepID=A0A914W0N6_9BILA